MVAPTSRRIAPLLAMISGIRNAPPISISSPRDTITSLPCASEFSPSSTAAALLFTTVAASAPVNCTNNCSSVSSRLPRLPAARSYSKLIGLPATAIIASMAACESRARPRLVCRIVPGGVDDADMAGPAFRRDLRLDLIEDRVVIEQLAFALPDFGAQLIQNVAAFLRDVIVIVARQQCGAARMIEQAIDRGQLAQQSRGLVGHEESKICTGWGQIQLGSVVSGKLRTYEVSADLDVRRGGLQASRCLQEYLLNGWWKIEKQKVSGGIQVILALVVDDSDILRFRSTLVRQHLVDPARR